MSINSSLIGLSVIASDAIAQPIAETSAFMALGAEIPASVHSRLITSVSGIQSTQVGEGQLKKSSGASSVKRVKGNKFQASVVLTEEAILSDLGATVANAIGTAFPTAHAKAIDATIFGTQTINPAFEHFGTFTGAGTELDLDADGVAAFDAILEAGNGNVTALALTRKAYNGLRKLRNVNGVRSLEWTGDAKAGTVEGIPYAVAAGITGDDGLIVAGDFANFYQSGVSQFGAMGSENGVRWVEYGNWTDVNDTVHNLSGENKVALVSEVLAASAIVDATAFTKFTLAAATVED